MRLRLAVATTFFLGTVTAPVSVSAVTLTCPDHFVLVPTQAVPPDKQKRDRNNNGFLCAKVEDGHAVIGPDDKIEDDLVL